MDGFVEIDSVGKEGNNVRLLTFTKVFVAPVVDLGLGWHDNGCVALEKRFLTVYELL